MGPQQMEKLAKLFASWPSREERKKDLDTWDLTLRCDHVVPHIQHREHSYVSASVVDCPECGERRGVVSSERVGPAYRDDGTMRERAAADRERLARELAAVDRQRGEMGRQIGAIGHRQANGAGIGVCGDNRDPIDNAVEEKRLKAADPVTLRISQPQRAPAVR